MSVVPTPRRISILEIYKTALMVWEKISRQSGDRKNFTYEIPSWRGWVLLRMSVTHEGVLYMNLLHNQCVQPIEIRLGKIHNGNKGKKIGGAELLEMIDGLDVPEKHDYFSLQNILTDIGVEAGILERREERIIIEGMQPYGC